MSLLVTSRNFCFTTCFYYIIATLTMAHYVFHYIVLAVKNIKSNLNFKISQWHQNIHMSNMQFLHTYRYIIVTSSFLWNFVLDALFALTSMIIVIAIVAHCSVLGVQAHSYCEHNLLLIKLNFRVRRKEMRATKNN